jgi:hypothetical protein
MRLLASAALKNHERSTVATSSSQPENIFKIHSEKTLSKSNLCSQAKDGKLIRKITYG